MKVRISSLVALLAILVSFSASAIAQSKTESSFPVRTNVLVTEDAKKYVNDMTKDDFTLTENGVAQPITYFAKRQGPLNLVIIADNTGSMRSQLEMIIMMGKYFVSNLQPGDRAKVVRFVGSDKIATVQDWSDSKMKLNDAFDNLFIEGGQSVVLDALYYASEDLTKHYDANKDQRFAIVLISDLEDRASKRSEKDLMKILGGRDVPVHSLALTGQLVSSIRKSVEAFSNRISITTGGTPFILGAKALDADYQTAVKALVLELRSQYVIGYEAKNVDKKAANRVIQIAAKDGSKGEKRSVTSKTNILLPVD